MMSDLGKFNKMGRVRPIIHQLFDGRGIVMRVLLLARLQQVADIVLYQIVVE